MNFGTLTRIGSLLRHDGAIEAAGGLLKVAGKFTDTIVNAAKAIDRGAVEAGRHLAEKGHPNLALAARVSPYVVGGIAAKKGYDSEPSIRVRNWIAQKRYERAMRQQGMY